MGSTFKSTCRDVVSAHSAICCMRLPVLESSLLVGLPPYGSSHLSCWRLVSPIRLPSPVSGLHHNKDLSNLMTQFIFQHGNTCKQVTLCCRSHAALQSDCVECRRHSVAGQKRPYFTYGATLCCRTDMAFFLSCDFVLIHMSTATIPMSTPGIQEDQSRSCFFRCRLSQYCLHV